MIAANGEAFESRVRAHYTLDLPAWPVFRPGVRVMMMPFYIDDPEASLPRDMLGHEWIHTVEDMCDVARDDYKVRGLGYLTIDEAIVKRAETHRRPGLHVDGVGPAGGWNGGGYGGDGGYGKNGMLMVASHLGAVAYQQDFRGQPGPDGSCEHLVEQLDQDAAVPLVANRVHYCTGLTVHEALPLPRDTRRQFCRVSFPSNAPWYEGYTANPYGIEPAGPIHPPRAEFMGYRP